MIKDETKRNPDDRCRLVASKSDTWGELKVTIDGVVNGPNFEKYQPDFEKEIENNQYLNETKILSKKWPNANATRV